MRPGIPCAPLPRPSRHPSHEGRRCVIEKLQKILVASDLSSFADRALARAVQLANQHEARLLVLHAVERIVGSERENWLRLWMEPPGHVETELMRDAEATLRQRLEPLTRARPAKCDVRASIGRAFVEIIRQARAEAASLVVVGARGENDVRSFLLGTTAERVVRKGDRPTLLVKKMPKGPYRRVIVPIDFSDTSRRALSFAARLAPGAHITALHVYDIWYEARLRATGGGEDQLTKLQGAYVEELTARLDEFLRASDVSGTEVTPAIKRGQPARIITETASRSRADLVAIGTRGMGGLRHVLMGSVAERVLIETRCDVAAVPSGQVEFELP